MTKIYFLIFLLISALLSVSGYSQNTQVNPDSTNSVKQMRLTYKILKDSNATYGYDIYSGDKLIIHQPTIPGLPGNNGFSNKKNAEDVAKLVIKKIKKGEMPPSVSVDELKKLNAIK